MGTGTEGLRLPKSHETLPGEPSLGDLLIDDEDQAWMASLSTLGKEVEVSRRLLLVYGGVRDRLLRGQSLSPLSRAGRIAWRALSSALPLHAWLRPQGVELLRSLRESTKTREERMAEWEQRIL